ncbi:stage II sporulation protein D [Virgibacillus byunsanensis]|uniref:Stage II sporulation protein D n=1 Tax=Virgibacillus byunsanensis TaxID=570945 RepID=A0ABW3LIS2_9BACI
MKNRKYKYKTVPKSWKQRKTTMRKQQRTHQRDSYAPVKLGKGKSTQFKQPSPWKVPSLVFLIAMVTIILVIPTLVVVPFIKDEAEESNTIDETVPSETIELTAGDSPFSVAVMRANSEKIEDVPLETYVARVVASEMPGEFEVEALKAQSLAARTYIVNHLLYQDNPSEPDVTDTTSHQVYNNDEDLRRILDNDYNWKMEKITEAVAATKGEILTYEDTTITPAYFSTSNGYTENSEDYWENKSPYLRSVESPWDEDSPKFLDQKIFTINDVEQTLAIDLPNGELLTMRLSRTESGRVSELALAGNTFSGRKVREALDLRSSDFTIEQKNNHLIFTTKGFGHGIGMSQYGANGMAEEGKSYQEIVKHYYQGVEISQLSDTAPTLVSK